MSTEFGFVTIDANQRVETQQATVRQLVNHRVDFDQFRRNSPLPCRRRSKRNGNSTGKKQRSLKRSRRIPPREKAKPNSSSRVASDRSFYGDGIPGVKPEELAGKLIVGRRRGWFKASTQIASLVEWLEITGHATVQVGLKRSTLVSEELERAQNGNILSRTTLSLFLRHDFADQMENVILPSLKAGFVVLAGSLHLHADGARHGARHGHRVVEKIFMASPFKPDAVFISPSSPRSGAARRQDRDARLLGERHGLGIVARSV